MKSTKKKIAICWLGIGDYNIMFDQFYKSFKLNFCTECERKFFIFTDQPEIVKDKADCNVYILTEKCNDRAWVRFRKFKYLMQAEYDFIDYDYVCYMNGNMVCQKKVVLDELLPAGTTYAAVVHPSNKPLRAKCRLLNPLTNASFMPKFDIMYKQSGWILAETKSFLHMCNTIEGWRCLDKANENDKFVSRHDEAYYNKYLYYHENKINHLKAAIYLCPDEWPIANNAKMIQVKKETIFGKNNKVLQEDKQADVSYSK